MSRLEAIQIQAGHAENTILKLVDLVIPMVRSPSWSGPMVAENLRSPPFPSAISMRSPT